MELKEGMYVRYIPTLGIYTQKISKITKVKNCLLDMAYYLDNSEEPVFSSHFDDIVGASENIIDLITENDLLEIKYLIRSYKHQVEVLEVIKNYEGRLYVNAFPRRIFIEDFKSYRVEIISIVTKEQFESIAYKVEKEW